MKPSIVVGIVIGALVVGAGLLAPQFRSGDSKAAAEARAKADLAERLLARYDYPLPQLARLTDPAGLKDANLESLTEQIRERLRQINQEQTAALGRIKARAAADGLAAPTGETFSADAGGVRRALEQYQSLLTANNQRLNEAAQVAKDARAGDGAIVLGVPQVSGVVEYVRATSLFAEAQVMRQQQQALLARLLRLGTQWKAYRAYQDRLAGLDVNDILGQLRKDLDEVRQMKTEATGQSEVLGREVSQREQELGRVEADLAAAQSELLALEQKGFAAGDDKSFNSYRDKFTALSTKVRTLEEKQQLLSAGGLRDAKWSDENVETAEIEGQEVVGLDVLKRRLATAQEKAQRLTAGVESVQEYINFVEQAGDSAKQGEERYAALQTQLDTAQKAVVEPLLELAKQASAKEGAALTAARESASAFAAAQQAAEKWFSAASELQNTKDTERANSRLKLILSDPTVKQAGSSAQAAALMLTGRLCAARLEAAQSLVSGMKLFVEMRPGTEFKPDEFEAEINTARDSALDALKKAEGIYNRLAKEAPAATKWIPQAGLATVYELLARVNPAESTTLLASALQNAEDAVKGKEQSPHVTEHVVFRDYLRAKTGVGEKTESQPATDSNEPPTEGG